MGGCCTRCNIMISTLSLCLYLSLSFSLFLFLSLYFSFSLLIVICLSFSMCTHLFANSHVSHAFSLYNTSPTYLAPSLSASHLQMSINNNDGHLEMSAPLLISLSVTPQQ